jgi:hypothetical protein
MTNPSPLTPIVSAANYCIGIKPSLLSATASSGNSLLWYGTSATGGIAASIAPTPLTSSIGVTDYYVSQIKPTGCESQRAKISVTINPLPIVTSITGTSSICIGVTSTLSNATSGGVWTSGTPSIATINSSGVVTGVAAGTSVISYTVTNASGCQSIATLSITFFAAPIIPIISANGPTAFCSGGNVVLTASTSTGNQWYKDGIAITGATNNTYTANATSSITDTVVNASGCKAGSLATLVVMDPQSSPVKPVISSLTNDTTVCFRDSIVLQSSNYYNKYLWSTGDTLQTITVKKSDNISLRGSASGSNCFSVPSATLSLIKNVNVLPAITYGTNSLISSQSNYYKWFYNNLPAAGVSGYTFTNPAQGFYHVETSLDNFCWDASFDYAVVLTNTPLINDSVSVSTYPNPSTGTFNVVADFEKLTNVLTKIIVSDMTGKVIYQSQKMIFLSKKIIIPVNLGTSKGTFAVNMDINGTIKTVIIVVN